MDVLPLLRIIRNPGISINGLAAGMGVTDRHASKIAIGLNEAGAVEKRREGKLVRLFPVEASPITGALLGLEEACSRESGVRTEDVVSPVNNLKLIGALASGPMTVNQLTACLKISRPTFYRMLKGFGEDGLGLVGVRGTREKEYYLNRRHWLFPFLVPLARGIFGDVVLSLDDLDFKKLHLTSLRPRILLYLSQYLPFQDSFVVPTAITQQGLARALWTTQPIISKELRRLMDTKLVSESRQHVKNEKRMYKTYHLTHEGIREVEKLQGILEGTTVPVVDFNGVRDEKPMSEVPSLFSMRVRSIEVLNYLSTEDILNFNLFQKMLGSRRESEFISVLHRLPRLKYFFGRDKERKRFRQWLGSGTSRVFLIRGIAGMGKTTFLTKVIQENKQNWNIFFYSIKEWSTPRNIISHIAHFLERLKRPGIATWLENKGEFTLDEAMLLLEEPFRDSKALMMFDDIQKADETILDFFTALIKSGIIRDVKLVLGGREMMGVEDLLEEHCAGHFLEQDLEGLERAPSEQLLSGRGIPRSQFDAIYSLTGGHPLALELVETRTGIPDMNLKAFIREEIVPKMSPREAEILMFVSIFRYPFTADVLLLGYGRDGGGPGPDLGGEPFAVISPDRSGRKVSRKEQVRTSKLVERLVKRSFLIHDGESYYLHDIFRDFFYNRMDPRTRSRYHLIAADHYDMMDNDPAWVEAIYHLLSAGDLEGAARHLDAHGETLIKRGFSRELLGLFREADLERLTPGSRVGAYYHMGEMRYISGQWDEALASYEASVRECRAQGEEALATRALIKLARIRSLLGRQEEALKGYEEAIGSARRHKQFLLESDAVKQVGSRHYFMGNLDELKKNYKRALEIAQETESRECLANAQFLNTFLTKLKGEYDRCVELHKECLRTYEEIGNQSQALMVLNNLGDIYFTLERYQEALEMFESVKEISESVGDLQHKGFGLVNSGDALIKLRRYPEAEENLMAALDLFTSLKEKRLILGTQAIIANLYKAEQEPEKARQFYEKAINGYKENSMLLDLPVFLFEYADMEEGLGEREKARSLFKDALKYAKRMDNKRWINESNRRLKALK